MKDAKELFFRRMRENIRFQIRVFRMVGDWSIILYIGIPALLLGFAYYIQLWNESPEWIEFVPFQLAVIVLFLFVFNGEVRYFIEEADILFLRQQRDWIRRLISRGIYYSILRDAFFVAVVLTLFAPFLMQHYGLSFSEMGLLFIFSLLIKANVMFSKRYIFYYWNGFILTGLNVLLFLGVGVLYVGFVGIEFLMWAVSGLCAVSLYFFMKNNIHSTAHFLKDVEKEQELNMRWVGIFLDTGGHVEKRPLFTRDRPYLFSKSQRIFNRSEGAYRLADIYIKLFLRSRSSIKLYLQLTGIAMAGMFLLPVWAKGVLWIAIMLLASLMIKENIRQSREHSYLNMFRWNEGTHQSAIQMAHFHLLLPISFVTSAVFGWFVWSWIGMLLFLCASPIFARMCTRFVMIKWAEVFNAPLD